MSDYDRTPKGLHAAALRHSDAGRDARALANAVTGLLGLCLEIHEKEESSHPLVDDLRAYAEELLESPSADDRNVGQRLRGMVETYGDVR